MLRFWTKAGELKIRNIVLVLIMFFDYFPSLITLSISNLIKLFYFSFSTRVLKSTTGLMIGKRVKLRGKSALQTVGSVNSHRRDPSPVHRTHLRPVTNTSSPSPIQGRLPAPSSTSPVPVKGVSPNHPLPPVASSPSPPTTIPELMKRPLKERIVHLLAVRPYKKPEIHGRLIKGKTLSGILIIEIG